MDTINRAALLELIEREPGLGISLYMPLHVGRETRQDPVRLKNLLNQAEEELVARGVGRDRAAGLTAALRAASDKEGWFALGGQGFAAFIGEGFDRQYRFDLDLPEKVSVGETFAVKPLLPALSEAGHYYILGLSENAPRLLLATRSDVQELELVGMPKSLNDYMKLEDREEHLQMHSSGSPQSGDAAGMFHGSSSSWNDEEKQEIPGYMKAIAKGVDDMLRADGAPLLIAGVEHMCAMYRRENAYAGLAEPTLQGNVDDMSPRQLQLAAWDKIEPVLHGWEQAATEKLDNLLGTAAAISSEADIVVAAVQGRIDTLLVAADEEVWGTFHDDTQTVTLADGPGGGAVELTEFAAAWALRTSAVAFSRPRAAIPGGSRMAAILRY